MPVYNFLAKTKQKVLRKSSKQHIQQHTPPDRIEAWKSTERHCFVRALGFAGIPWIGAQRVTERSARSGAVGARWVPHRAALSCAERALRAGSARNPTANVLGSGECNRVL